MGFGLMKGGGGGRYCAETIRNPRALSETIRALVETIRALSETIRALSVTYNPRAFSFKTNPLLAPPPPPLLARSSPAPPTSPPLPVHLQGPPGPARTWEPQLKEQR